MALPVTLRNATLVLSDATGTPKTFTIVLSQGSATFTSAGHSIVRQRNTAGDFTGAARLGEQAGVSTVSFQAVITSAGNHASTVALLDFAKPVGYGAVASIPWKTTTDTLASELKSFDLALTTSDTTLGNAGTAEKGAAYKLTDCIIQPGVTLEANRTGWLLSMTWESPDAHVTITQNS